MRPTGAFLIVCLCASGAWSQTQDQNPAATQSQPAQDRDPTKSSVLDVKPGQEVIKPKDLWTDSGIFHPFLRMPKYIWQDQKAIWTSPFHTSKKNAKYWAIFGGATAALIATDKYTARDLPNSSSQVSVSNWVSRFGSAYSLIPISAGFYFIGSGIHDDRLRETGLLCFEALIDSSLAVEAIKLVADRARPLEGNGNGNFESSPNGRWNSSFPSGHSITTWAMASAVAHQYPHPRIIPILAYAFAGTVVVSRVGARKHFPGDVVAGSAMGWFIGDYVYGRRHNPELDQKKSVSQKILDHVRLGLDLE
ncbi:MAG: phosphatase PAP2 family protein [Candidatus Sulfopaludibacter sp.]|nr:phosphatase PAP2 family protein [Candidatus Sulfopaludibacter sp.]